MLLQERGFEWNKLLPQPCCLIVMRGLKIAICAAYFLLLIVLSYNLPFSMFFTKFHSYKDLFQFVENSNQIRSRKGKDYFNSLNSESSLDFYKQQIQSNDLLLAIGIISIQRFSKSKMHESFGYLFQSASSFDKMLKNNKQMNNSVAFICNVELYPKNHKDAQYVSQFMPYAERFGDNSIGLKEDMTLPNSNVSYKNVEGHSSIYEKETYDYVYCMAAAASLKPRYILLVEEDTVPHKDFPNVLNYLFHNLLNDAHLLDMSFIKFYFPSKWQGFAFRMTEIIDLISLSILGTTIYCLFSYCLFQRRDHYKYDNLKKDILIGFFISMLSCHILGRQNIIELRRMSPFMYRIQPSEMCCTQAMLYPTHIVHPLSNFMLTQAYTAHTDLLIWDFAFTKHMRSYQVEPNLFYHTGLHSSLLSQQKHPQEFIFFD